MFSLRLFYLAAKLGPLLVSVCAFIVYIFKSMTTTFERNPHLFERNPHLFERNPHVFRPILLPFKKIPIPSFHAL